MQRDREEIQQQHAVQAALAHRQKVKVQKVNFSPSFQDFSVYRDKLHVHVYIMYVTFVGGGKDAFPPKMEGRREERRRER